MDNFFIDKIFLFDKYFYLTKCFSFLKRGISKSDLKAERSPNVRIR